MKKLCRALLVGVITSCFSATLFSAVAIVGNGFSPQHHAIASTQDKWFGADFTGYDTRRTQPYDLVARVLGHATLPDHDKNQIMAMACENGFLKQQLRETFQRNQNHEAVWATTLLRQDGFEGQAALPVSWPSWLWANKAPLVLTAAAVAVTAYAGCKLWNWLHEPIYEFGS